jgi:signal transduction histidine kinase
MRLVIQSIYAKILLWFWVVAIGTTAVVMLIANLSGAQPRAHLWMSLATGVYARGAVDIYIQGGKPALGRYMNEIESSHGIRATLLDPEGRDILAKGTPADSSDLVRDARETEQDRFRGGIVYTEAEPISTSQGIFVLVAQVHPWAALGSPIVVAGLVLKSLIALICAGLLCTILAGQIAGPIRALQTAARRIADGDLSVRAMPAIARRHDEVANLARDFDRMAERIQGLLQKQQELLGDISHELRSPLARLNVSLELMRRGEGDPALLRSCIENVVRNAIRYTRPQTGVIIALSRVEERGAASARIVVSDYGKGVPSESLPRLFEPFYCVSEARDLRTGGFGLGLAIAQRVALMYQGRITARNRPGGGLEIEIELPLNECVSSPLPTRDGAMQNPRS